MASQRSIETLFLHLCSSILPWTLWLNLQRESAVVNILIQVHKINNTMIYLHFMHRSRYHSVILCAGHRHYGTPGQFLAIFQFVILAKLPKLNKNSDRAAADCIRVTVIDP